MSKIKFKVIVTVEKEFEIDRELYAADWTNEQILEHELTYAEEWYFVEWENPKVTAKAELLDGGQP